MRLDRLLEALKHDAVRVVSGQPKDFQVVESQALKPGRVPPRNALLLLPNRDALEEAARLGPRPLVVAQEDWDASSYAQTQLSEARACVLAWQGRIPLDFSAVVERALYQDDPSVRPGGDAQTQAREDLIEEVVQGRHGDNEAIVRRAQALGIPLGDLHGVLLVGFLNYDHFFLTNEHRGESFFQQVRTSLTMTVRREVGRQRDRSVVAGHNDGLVVLTEGDPEPLGRTVAEAVRRDVKQAPVVVTSGGTGHGPTGLHRSYQEAVQALDLRRRLKLRSRFVAYHELRGYALLHTLERQPELVKLLEAEIEPLRHAKYGNPYALLETLAAYWDAGSSQKDAAEHLGIHPKTLRYRLDRIEDVLGDAAHNEDRRVIIHLACKLALWKGR